MKKKMIFSDFSTAINNGKKYIFIMKNDKKNLVQKLEGLLPKSYCERWIVLQY